MVGDGVAGLEALQVLGQAIVFGLQVHQLGLPAHPAALQLAPLLPLALNLPGQVVHHSLKRTWQAQMLSLLLSLLTHTVLKVMMALHLPRLTVR